MFGMALQLESSALLLYGRILKVTGSDSPALKRDRAIVLRTRGCLPLNLTTDLDSAVGVELFCEYSGILFELSTVFCM